MPYFYPPAPIPGRIEAENYDRGGEGVAYHDSDAGNDGGEYRTDDVDLDATSDAGCGYHVGWIGDGEWLEYTLNVTEAGAFTRAGACTDVPPDGEYSCAAQAGWGKCGEAWMADRCDRSCGRCTR